MTELKPNPGQREMVLNHLKKAGSITSWEAIKEYGITRLSEYIRQLRVEGMVIKSEDITEPNRYGRKTTFTKYHLV